MRLMCKSLRTSACGLDISSLGRFPDYQINKSLSTFMSVAVWNFSCVLSEIANMHTGTMMEKPTSWDGPLT